MQAKNCLNLLLFSALAGCATLPSSGPTGHQIEKSATIPKDGTAPIALVQIDTIADVPVVGPSVASGMLSNLVPPPTDLIGPGDVLDINIYEAGVTLFSGPSGTTANAAQIASTPGVQVQKLPPLRVDDLGDIRVPYAGKLHVAGSTVAEVEAKIRKSLQSLSQDPQVIVTMNQAITNTVIVGGEVAKPGRLVLQTNRETLSDVVALAGGYRGNTRDLTLRVMRNGKSIDLRMNDLADNPTLDVPAYPGDRLTLISNPRTYSVLGASGRVEEAPFTRSHVSLAEAIAAAGGANPGIGDPKAIFVFRYVSDAQGNETPVVYHLNMMKTNAYFLAQRFAMRDKDVLYVGSAAANQPSKVVQLISQLFSPILTVTSAVQTVQNSRN